jgi:hypothetical protein
MGTKYIVNNVSGQTITGDLTIQGSLVVTGTSTNNFAKYSALLTQTGNISGNTLSNFDYGLIIGETYTITTYQNGDDFSNIANVITGDINTTGCVFIATGQTPTVWNNYSELSSLGNLIVDVLENDLGFDISWEQAPFGGSGYYIGVNSSLGPLPNQFPRNRTKIATQIKYPFDGGGPFGFPVPISGIGTLMYKDCTVFIDMFYNGDLADNGLYYTPVEISIKRNFDTTPILVYGLNVSSFPYGNVSVRLYSDENLITTFYNDTYIQVNNITEMVAALNNDTGTNFLGTYSIDENVEGGVILSMPNNLYNQFSSDNTFTLTFEVFND